MATGRINRKVVRSHRTYKQRELKQMQSINRFKKRSRNWQAWYTKICYKARAKQR